MFVWREWVLKLIKGFGYTFCKGVVSTFGMICVEHASFLSLGLLLRHTANIYEC